MPEMHVAVEENLSVSTKTPKGCNERTLQPNKKSVSETSVQVNAIKEWFQVSSSLPGGSHPWSSGKLRMESLLMLETQSTFDILVGKQRARIILEPPPD